MNTVLLKKILTGNSCLWIMQCFILHGENLLRQSFLESIFETFPNISDNVYMDDDDRSELEKAMALFE